MILLSVIALVIGTAIGLSIADVDHIFPFLTHRAAITHSFLLPLIAYLVVREREPWAKMGVVGFCLGMIVHISFDLFPRSWSGAALIHMIGFGALPPTASILLICISMVVCFYLVFLLVEKRTDLIAGLIALCIAFGMASAHETVFWWALLSIVVTLVIALLLPVKTNIISLVQSMLKG
ncbi:MAG: hypothetical protein HC837_05340 [Chloroflexaceae bacterium]|nr:hypothetical protein [Chloroflexaceae bacterium]